MSIELVDLELCNGCGLCVITCPLDVIRLDTVVADREEYPDCRRACPAGVDMRRYINLLKDGMVKEALAVLRESLPLPSVTGRVCPHPCESDCSRREVDDAVNINALERYVADYFFEEKAELPQTIYAAGMAVVGSGPAGLSCAYFLRRMGYPVTVFEAQSVLGGMLRLGIPEFRLPRRVLDAQLDYIRDMGVEFRTGITVGRDVAIEELLQEHAAVFYATGNPLSRRIEIDGVALDGVLWGLEFLVAVNLRQRTEVKGTVVVVGGGMWPSMWPLTALRVGATGVDMVCLEAAEEMPAFKEEVGQALEEGVRIHHGWGPRRVLGAEGRVTGVELVRCDSVYDNRGRFCPSYDETVTRMVDADMVIMAIGQASDPALLPPGLETGGSGAVLVDPITLETSLPAVFAGGDVVSGPASVVEAIASGRRASASIDRYFKREDLRAGRYLLPKRVKKAPKEGMESLEREQTPVLPVDLRTGSFEEIKRGFDEDTANREVRRCMTCGSRAVISYVDDCMLCLHCEHYCPQKAIYVSPEKRVAPLVPWG